MGTTYIKAKKIILEKSVIENAFLEINEQGKFGQVLFELPSNTKYIDYANYIIAPGLVDTHIHGYRSYDVMDNSFEALEAISKSLLACGVTSWLPTTLTDSIENLNAVSKTIGDNYHKVSGAKIRGIFLEGPFFTEKYKGAQNEKYMGDPSIDLLANWHTLSNQLINKIAIAPERKGITEFIEFANSLGIATALGHSDATYDDARKAVKAGANIFVHTFNGMRGLHHREPGMVGAALSLDNVYTEIIADGFHLHPAVIDIILKAREKHEAVLITDCMRAGGQGEGLSSLGEFEVMVKDGAARLTEGGNLAGSILELIQAVQNIVKWELASIEDALRMASFNPAKSVGIEHLSGSIQEGFEADFIVVDDQANLIATYLDGKKRYEV